MSDSEKELDKVKKLNINLSKALAEEMDSNFKLDAIKQNLEKTIEEIKILTGGIPEISIQQIKKLLAEK